MLAARRVHDPRLLAFATACFIGTADATVALATAVLTRPHVASLLFGVAMLAAYATALARPRRSLDALRARPALLAPLIVVATAPALLDGGADGTLATQAGWLVLVAAVALPWRWLVVSTLVAAGAKAGVYLATGIPSVLDVPADVRLALVLPLALAPLGLVLAHCAGVLSGHLAPPPLPAAPAPVPAPLSPAQREVVDLLAQGLAPKQIAVQRGTSLATVRTQIKLAKRAAGARTVEHLVAVAWEPR